MTGSNIIKQRLAAHGISPGKFDAAGDMISELVAMQAQDYLGSLWSVGLRLPKATESDVEQAIADKMIIRTWALRGTLHFVNPEDVRWILKLIAPRINPAYYSNAHRHGLDDKSINKGIKEVVRLLEGGGQLTRDEIRAHFKSKGIPSKGQHTSFILLKAALDGLICFGPRHGKQLTFVLLDEWIPSVKNKTRDVALAELTFRYFTGHGPATLQDFIWWSGLTQTDAKAGLEMVKSQLVQESYDDQIYWMKNGNELKSKSTSSVNLLPGFDEYLLGYKNQGSSLKELYIERVKSPANGFFQSTININGKVAGFWARTIKDDTVTVEINPFMKLSEAQAKAINSTAKIYAKFLGKRAKIAILK